MKISEKCASYIVLLGTEAFAKPLQVFNAGGPATVPLRLLRQGRESPNLIMLRGLLSVAVALPAGQCDEAFETLSYSVSSSLARALSAVDLLAGAAGVVGVEEEWAEAVATAGWALRSFGVLAEGIPRIALGIGPGIGLNSNTDHIHNNDTAIITILSITIEIGCL